MKYYNQLKEIFKKQLHLQYLQRILLWEDLVTMPTGAGIERANALVTFKQLSHAMLNTNKVKSLLIAAKNETLSSWDEANLCWMEKIYLSLSIVPSKLQAKAEQANLLALQAWRKYREENDWKSFKPYLRKSFNLIKEIAERKSQVFHLQPYDVLIDGFSSGLNQNFLDNIFINLKSDILKLREAILVKQSQESYQPLITPLELDTQKKLVIEIMKKMKFDFQHGRLDTSHHPYCDGVSTDIRVTTRYNRNNVFDALYDVLHETGHALYEQGVPKDWIFQPVGHPQCKLTHESQSLLFENEVGRSRAFFQGLEKFLYQIIGKTSDFNAENMFLNCTRIKQTLIRLESDEVSYPLHIIMRYDIEKSLFNNEIDFDDLPSFWADQTDKYLGLSSKNNYKDGVMQDMHWAFGYFGYFPIYVCGQMMASQLFSKFINEHSNFSEEIKELNFDNLHTWLHRNIYAHASSKSWEDLLLSSTQETLNSNSFISQLEKRYLS